MNEQAETNELSGLPSVDKPWLKFYTEHELRGEIPNISAYEAVWDFWKDHGNLTLIKYINRSYTVREFFENVDAYARAFKAKGVVPGDIVPIAIPNGPENMFCMYALNKIGAIADFVDPRSKGEILEHYLKETSCKVFIACDLFYDDMVEAAGKLNVECTVFTSPYESLTGIIKLLMAHKVKKIRRAGHIMRITDFLNDGSNIQIEQTFNDIAMILHTSGTTGDPKSVMLPNRAMNAMAENYKNLGYDKRPLIPLNAFMMNQVPPFLAYNLIMATHVPLVLGAGVILLPDYRPDKFAENIARYKPDSVIAGPADWMNFLESNLKNRNYSFLTYMCSGSDKIDSDYLDRINRVLKEHGCKYEILEGYGMTEISTAACMNLPGKCVKDSVGIPLPKVDFCIYDNDTDAELTYGEIGEICMTGETLMRGYLNDPESTSEMLRVHGDGQVWLHSGDLGYINENGYVFVQGRIKRIIVRYDGIKISPFAIEKVMNSMAFVKESCTVGTVDREHGMGQLAVSYVVITGDKDPEEAVRELSELCERELAPKYRPTFIKIRDSLPLTPNGKVDYRYLEKQL